LIISTNSKNLFLPEIKIKALLGQELGMSTKFLDTTMTEHSNLIAALDSTKTMGNH
jgi:hypothetical protein